MVMRRGRKGIRTKEMIQIAKERIEILFQLADNEAIKHNFRRANRYVELARKIGMRYNVRIPSHLKRRFCKHCYSYLLPTVTSTVRISRHRVIVRCLNCGKHSRFPYIREIKQRRVKHEEI